LALNLILCLSIEKKSNIFVIDDGDGMDDEDINEYLLRAFASSKRGNDNVPGEHGIGLISALKDYDILIDTQKDGKNKLLYITGCESEEPFTVYNSEGRRAEDGTSAVLIDSRTHTGFDYEQNYHQNLRDCDSFKAAIKNVRTIPIFSETSESARVDLMNPKKEYKSEGVEGLDGFIDLEMDGTLTILQNDIVLKKYEGLGLEGIVNDNKLKSSLGREDIVDNENLENLFKRISESIEGIYDRKLEEMEDNKDYSEAVDLILSYTKLRKRPRNGICNKSIYNIGSKLHSILRDKKIIKLKNLHGYSEKRISSEEIYKLRNDSDIFIFDPTLEKEAESASLEGVYFLKENQGKAKLDEIILEFFDMGVPRFDRLNANRILGEEEIDESYIPRGKIEEIETCLDDLMDFESTFWGDHINNKVELKPLVYKKTGKPHEDIEGLNCDGRIVLNINSESVSEILELYSSGKIDMQHSMLSFSRLLGHELAHNFFLEHSNHFYKMSEEFTTEITSEINNNKDYSQYSDSNKVTLGDWFSKLFSFFRKIKSN